MKERCKRRLAFIWREFDCRSSTTMKSICSNRFVHLFEYSLGIFFKYKNKESDCLLACLLKNTIKVETDKADIIVRLPVAFASKRILSAQQDVGEHTDRPHIRCIGHALFEQQLRCQVGNVTVHLDIVLALSGHVSAIEDVNDD